MAQLVLRLSSKLPFRSKHDRVGNAAGPDRLQLVGRVDLSSQRDMEVYKQKALTNIPRVPVHGVKLSVESAVGCLSTCPRAHTGFASHLHLCNIAVRHVQKLDTVITARLQTSWESLLHKMAFAQAISVHGRIVRLTNTLSLHIQTCRATRASMAKRAPFYGHQHGEMTCVFWSSKCGLRGVRVGEASKKNPGPQSPQRKSPSQDDGEPDALSVEPPFPVRSCCMPCSRIIQTTDTADG